MPRKSQDNSDQKDDQKNEQKGHDSETIQSEGVKLLQQSVTKYKCYVHSPFEH